MKKTVLAFALFAFSTAPAFAQTKAEGKDTKSPAQAAQQQRMKDCNADAKGMKGEQRSTFMSSCLKGETEKSGRTAQQNKMASCNKQASAKNMKGDDRRQFMSECLKG